MTEWEPDERYYGVDEQRDRDWEERERQAELERDRVDRFRDRGDMGETRFGHMRTVKQ